MRPYSPRLDRLESRELLNATYDPGFNTIGRTTVNFGLGVDNAIAVEVDASDRTILLANTNFGDADSLLISRLTTTGKLDPTFSGDGLLRLDTTNDRSLTAIDLESSSTGEITVLAENGSQAVLYRITSTGELDTTFGTDGVVRFGFTDQETSAAPKSLLLDADGKIIIVGSASKIGDDNYLIVRFENDGTPDDSFGTQGVVNIDLGDSDVATQVVEQADGKLVVIGTTSDILSGKYQATLVRLTTSGDLDSTFGVDGKVVSTLTLNNPRPLLVEIPSAKSLVIAGTTDILNDLTITTLDNSTGKEKTSLVFDIGGIDDSVSNITVTSDNKLLFSGVSTSTDLVYLRTDATGAIDSTFGTDGVVRLTLPGKESVINGGIGLRSDGKIIAYTTDLSVTRGDQTVFQLTASGKVDTTFGTSGKVTLPVQGRSVEESIHFLPTPDGKTLIVSTTTPLQDDGYGLIGLARLNADGTLDNTFDGDGKLTINLGQSFEVSKASLQADGKILIGGIARDIDSGNSQTLLVRLNSNGTFDSTFDGDGKLALSSDDALEMLDLTIQPDGKILTVIIDTELITRLNRLNSNGAIDSTFGTNGSAVIPDFGGTVFGRIEFGADDDLFVYGHSLDAPYLLRLSNSGQLDTAFNSKVTPIVSAFGENLLRTMSIDSNGSFVLAFETETDLILTRLTSAGSVDSTFGSAGKLIVTTPSVTDITPPDVVALLDGTYLLSYLPADRSSLFVARVTANGQLDSTFGTNGISKLALLPGSGIEAISYLPSNQLVAVGTSLGSDGNDADVSRFNLDFVPITLTLDPTSDTGDSASDGITNTRTPQFTGKTLAGATVTLFDGATSIGTTTASADGTWTITAPALADGTYTLRASSQLAGNENTSETITITVDGTSPVVTLTGQPLNISTKSLSITLRFSESVTGLNLADFLLSGTSGGRLGVLSGTGQDYTLTIEDIAQSGTLTVTIRSDAANDVAGNGSITNTLDVPITLDSAPRLGGPNFIVAPGVGGTPIVRIIDGSTGAEVGQFTVFDPTFTGGVRVASGDINNDGVEDIIAGTGTGASTLVRVLNGKDGSELFNINPFESSFLGGVYVTVGDLNRDGFADLVITPDEGGGPRVQIISGKDGQPLREDFFGIDDPNFFGGARAALADVNGDGTLDLLIAAGFGGGPRIAVFDGKSLLADTQSVPLKLFDDFFVFESSLRNGVFISGGDLDGDGFAEVIAGGGPGGGPRIFALSGEDLVVNSTPVALANFFAGNPENRGGVRVTVKDIDGDALADLVTGAGDGSGSGITIYTGQSIAPEQQPSPFRSLDAFAGFVSGVFVG